jgi:hypothetical protein
MMTALFFIQGMIPGKTQRIGQRKIQRIGQGEIKERDRENRNE